jgi:hypothetical protein
MTTRLLIPIELDRLLRYPAGRSERLAKRGKIPHIKLPGGEVRFRPEDVDAILATGVCGAHSTGTTCPTIPREGVQHG